MIDEELYQQAADELNSDRRIPSLWARACALASDDHDEARFLYTNLRVEELIREREAGKKSAALPDDDGNTDLNDSTLSFEKLTLAEDDFHSNNDLPEDTTLSDSLASALDTENSIAADDNTPLESFNTVTMTEKPDPDAALMSDYEPDSVEYEEPSVAEDALDLDGTLAGDVMNLDDTISDDALDLDETLSDEELINRDFEQELARFKAEEAVEPEPYAPAETLSSADIDLSAATDTPSDSMDESDDIVLGETDNLTREFEPRSEHDQTNLDDLTQANVDVISLHANELDEMLVKPDSPSPNDAEAESEADMSWLDGEVTESSDHIENTQQSKPIVYEEDPYTEELSRQADELDQTIAAHEGQDQLSFVDSEPEIADYTPSEAAYPEPQEEPSSVASLPEQPAQSIPEPERSTDQQVAAMAASTAVASRIPQRPDDSPASDSPASSEYPLDLTDGQKGKLFSVYRRNNESQAVKQGVSWSALFFTLPYLVYRHLFATAFAYVLLWIIAIGGLLISGLAWFNAGAAVTPIIQACTIGFALLAFIGLVYLPFRYGNTWRSEKLEDRGFELVATARAKNPGRAIAHARRNAALNN
jgi:hypothetical protein